MDNNPAAFEACLVILGKDIPAIGPRLERKTDAVNAVTYYIEAINGLIRNTRQPYGIFFQKLSRGKYILFITGAGRSLPVLELDELTMKRFARHFKSRMFILTGFFESGGRVECLAQTEGMGVVMYAPGRIG